MSAYLHCSPEYNSLLCYSLTPLNDHLKRLEQETAAALAVLETKGSKKSTKDGKKRKAKGAQGTEKAKKANINVNGMVKISSFFKKAQ
jgi:ribonuclease H2 subunit B